MTGAKTDEIDALLSSDGFFQDPFPVYERMRAESPVHWSDANGGWMISRYDDVVESLRATEHFSSRGRFAAVLERLEPATRQEFDPLKNHFSVGLIASDPPDHTRLRGLINRAFTPKVVSNLIPRVRAITDELLDPVADRREMDLLREFAFHLPAIVISELIGVPVERREDFKRWTQGILSFQGTGRTDVDVLRQAQTDLLAMRGFLTDLAQQRRDEPRDDLMTRLVALEREGDHLSQGELLAMCVTLMTAGHETTTNLIASGMWLLLTHVEQRARLDRDRKLMSSAIEEMLRYQSPLQRNPRRVVEDLELHGQRLRKGDYVMQVLGSANRDPSQFDDPNRFDIGRQPNRHVAFGFGIHFCLGAPLARMEAPIAFNALLDRFPAMELATTDVRWHRHGLLRGVTSLPVRW